MKKILPLILILLMVQDIVEAQVTYTNEIANIVYNKCATCHRPGEIGPFSLTNYMEVKSYGETIKWVTGSRYMPPWKADPVYRHYQEENYLTDDQINKIAQWVDNGMPYGNANEEPSFPDYPEGSALGTPDLVLNFATRYLHKGNGTDEYRYFVLPTSLTENKIIKAIELRPGNKKIVHHALFFQDTTGKARSFDAKTAEYGFSANTAGFDVNTVLLYEQYPGYVPGQKPIRYPESFGQRMNKNADLVIQMHYAPTPIDEYDSTTVNVFFADPEEHIERFVKDRILLPSDLPGGFLAFNIPANQKRVFTGKWKTTQDLTFLSVFPHMHLLGKRWKVWLQKPNGTIENLIKIDDWDFNWQGGYYFNEAVIAPKGSTVYAEAEYDNTTNNPLNPNTPPIAIGWGEKTSDEMYYFPILHTPYKAGDEKLVFGQVTATADPKSEEDGFTARIFPNPMRSEMVNFEFKLSDANTLTIYLTDESGKVVRNLRKGEFYNRGYNFIHFDASQLNSGNYFMVVTGKNLRHTEKIQVIK